jgi:hypothetical protein
MNETEWLSCSTRPDTMLARLRGKASDRKLRLFACAACRRFWNELTDERSQAAVVASELVADGLASREELERRHVAASGVGLGPPWLAYVASTGEANAAAQAVALQGFWKASRRLELYPEPWADFKRALCSLLRELFGNPFRSIAVNRAWLAWNDGTVRRVAQAIYDARAFERMPILADALEDAGCGDDSILSHCRSERPHVRGCHVLDALLGKE